jgi:pimeloyl-ACP methyl ester carboxylesterase
MKRSQYLILVVIICLTGCSTLPRSERVTNTNGSYSYVLQGTGVPTVILESGLGDGRESWSPIFDEISKSAQVIAYDRAGYGRSKSAGRLRDGATIVTELRSMLHTLKLKPPYILVGHSLGGTFMELYARTYPEEVAGVVLVDSRHADFTRQCNLAGVTICAPPAALLAIMPNAPRQEGFSLKQTMDEVTAASNFPDIPLVVLSSGKHLLVGAPFNTVWLETQKSLATMSNNSTHTICKECGHYIHKDNPKLVINAIKSIIAQGRESKL